MASLQTKADRRSAPVSTSTSGISVCKTPVWTPKDLKSIQEQLDTPINEAELARRVGPGGKRISYVEGWFVLDQSNRIFGATGWSCEIKDIQVRVRPDKNKGWYAKARVIARVTLKDGTYHEDISVAGRYAKQEADAEMMACKTAVTDARKRVLRCFGRALGNSVYDKTSLLKKRPVPKFNRETNPKRKKNAQRTTNSAMPNSNAQKSVLKRNEDLKQNLKPITQPNSHADDLFGGSSEDELFSKLDVN